MLTLGNWIFIGIVALAGIVTAIHFGFSEGEPALSISTICITLVICLISFFGIRWYNTNTAAGSRAVKDYQSNMQNGIERSLRVIADDGMIVYEREGKFDVEIHDNYIVFDENHIRTFLYRSYTSTLIIEEIGS